MQYVVLLFLLCKHEPALDFLLLHLVSFEPQPDVLTPLRAEVFGSPDSADLCFVKGGCVLS